MKFLKFTSFKSPKELIVGCFYISTLNSFSLVNPAKFPRTAKDSEVDHAVQLTLKPEKLP